MQNTVSLIFKANWCIFQWHMDISRVYGVGASPWSSLADFSDTMLQVWLCAQYIYMDAIIGNFYLGLH